jgi:hypothetical protein
MSLKTIRIALLAGALAAVGVMSVATTSASASVTLPTEETCSPEGTPFGLLIGPVELEKPVSGVITVKKSGQTIALNGGRFAGKIALCIREETAVEGGIVNGSITFPPFVAPFKILNKATELATAITQVGPGEGTITRPPGPATPEEEEKGAFLDLNVQAQATFSFSQVDVITKKHPVSCETVEPVKLPIVKHLSILELLFGTTITGTATMPPIACGGGAGNATAQIMTKELSGPENPFTLNFEESKAIEP